ncbi:MAG: hypothetical protein H7Y15_17135, partial [Pseudonocardia sp.]|nr:hypothetical protein [Pseudonocardia sp.]
PTASTGFRRGSQVLPVLAAVLAVGAVVAGYVFYGLAGGATYADAAAARDRGDCTAAIPGYGLVSGMYELTLSGNVPRAEAERAECVAFVAASDAEAGGDFAGAVALNQEFRLAHPDTTLAPYVDDNVRRTYESWGTSLRSSGEYDEAVRVYRDLLVEIGDGPEADGVRGELAATLVEQADALRTQLPGLTGPALVDAIRDSTENLLTVQREFAETPAAAGVAQAIVDTYAAARTQTGCDALPLLDYAVGLPDAETAGVVGTANADRVRAQFDCGVARYQAGQWAESGTAFDQVQADYPNDPLVAQARANGIAAEVSEVTGSPQPLPGPYAGDNPGSIPLTLYNDNPAEVRVLIAGPTAHEVVLPGCPGCPAEYPSSVGACPSLDGKPSFRLTLPAGGYTVIGQYPSADPSVQSNLVESGFEYTNCLFVTPIPGQ